MTSLTFCQKMCIRNQFITLAEGNGDSGWIYTNNAIM